MNTKEQFDYAAKKFGDFRAPNGVAIAVTQDAWSENLAGEDCGYAYFANAIDADGNNYRVVWSVTNPDADDAQDACDWGDYRVIDA